MGKNKNKRNSKKPIGTPQQQQQMQQTQQMPSGDLGSPLSEDSPGRKLDRSLSVSSTSSSVDAVEVNVQKDKKIAKEKSTANLEDDVLEDLDRGGERARNLPDWMQSPPSDVDLSTLDEDVDDVEISDTKNYHYNGNTHGHDDDDHDINDFEHSSSEQHLTSSNNNNNNNDNDSGLSKSERKARLMDRLGQSPQTLLSRTLSMPASEMETLSAYRRSSTSSHKDGSPGTRRLTATNLGTADAAGAAQASGSAATLDVESVVQHKTEQVTLATLIANNNSLREKLDLKSKAELYSDSLTHGAFAEQIVQRNEDEDEDEFEKIKVKRSKDEIKFRMFRFVRSGGQTWLYLLLLGAAGAFFASLIQQALLKFGRLRTAMMDQCVTWGQCYVVYVLYCFVLGTAAVTIVQMMSPPAGGSGIPEMKSILSGNVIPRYLSWRTGIAKLLGLVLTLGSGLSVGRDGPYVHAMCVISHKLTKLRIFSFLRRVDALRLQMLAAACACGISGTFNTPIGGVLFSMEVTATYFMVSNIWKLFFAAVCGAVVGTLINPLLKDSEPTVLFTDFEAKHFGKAEYLAFIVLGVASGIAGAIFVWLVDVCVVFRMRHSKRVTPHVWVVLGVLVTAIVCFPFDVLMRNQLVAISDLLQEELDPVWSKQFEVHISMIINGVVRFVTGFYSTTLPVPVGVLQPLFSFGAAMGRMYGEAVAMLLGPEFNVLVGGYALVACAAMGAGVTRTLSTAILIFELSGSLTHMLPILIAVIMAVGVGNMFTYSFFDILMIRKGLPFFSTDMVTGTEKFTARDVMRPVPSYLTLSATFGSLVRALKATDHPTIPLVETEDNLLLMGAIQRNVLLHFLELKRNEVLASIPEIDPRNKKSKGVFLKTILTPITTVMQVANDGMNVLTAGTVNLPYMGEKPKRGRGRGRGPGGDMEDEDLDPLASASIFDDPANTSGTAANANANASANESISATRKPSTLGESRKGKEPRRESARDSAASASADPVERDLEKGLGSGASGSSTVLTMEMNTQRAAVANPADKLRVTPSLVSEAENKNVRRKWLVAWKRALAEPVDFLSPDMIIDPSPFQMNDMTPNAKIHFLFSMLGVHSALITNMGRLVGIITKEDLMSKMKMKKS